MYLAVNSDFLNNKRHGRGKYTNSDGTVFEGMYHEGELDGYGIKKYYNGDVYEIDLDMPKNMYIGLLNIDDFLILYNFNLVWLIFNRWIIFLFRGINNASIYNLIFIKRIKFYTTIIKLYTEYFISYYNKPS